MQHKQGQYRDGYIIIRFCPACGAEGLELVLNPHCPGDKNEPKQVDKAKEQD